MITRVQYLVRSTFWGIVLWVYGPWAICHNCEDYEPELDEDYIYHWCVLKGDEIDPNDTCRAFRGWRKWDGR